MSAFFHGRQKPACVYTFLINNVLIVCDQFNINQQPIYNQTATNQITLKYLYDLINITSKG
jgi:hypothetical protein